MERIKRRLLLCLALLLLPLLSSCTGRSCDSRPEGQIVVYADSSLEIRLTALAGSFGGATRLVFDDGETIIRRLGEGEKADLLILRGDAPAQRLVKERYIDNFAEIRFDSVLYTMAKPFACSDYARAQRLADYILAAS